MSDFFEAPLAPQNVERQLPENADIQQQGIAYNTMRLIGRGALVIGLAVASGAALGIAESVVENPRAAYATTTFANDYPNSDAAAYNVATYDWWVDENSNGIPDVNPDDTTQDEEMSPRNYGYRNCTDGVAYWIKKYTDVTLPVLGNAKDWETNAPSTYTVHDGATDIDNIEPADIAQSDDGSYGHVGFVTSVTKDNNGHVTSFTTAELNQAGQGEYNGDTATDKTSYSSKNSAGKFKRSGTYDWDHFIDVNGAGKGLNNETITGGGSTSSATLARPAAISFNGALNVFVRGGDNQIYNQYWNGTSWTGYSSIGGNMASDPALIVNGTALNVFARGADGQVYTKYNDGSGWSGWSSMGSQTMRGNPRIVQYGSEIDLFSLGSDGHPYKNTFNGSTWGGFSSLGNYMDSSPTPVVYGSELDVIMRGTNNEVYKDTWNGAGWTGFGSLGCCLLGNPDVITYGGQMTIWGNSSTNHIWKRTWNGSGWGNWEDFDGALAGDPDAMQYGNDMEVFARGTNGQMYTRYWSASGQIWSGWASTDPNHTVAGDPTAIQYGSELDVFAVGADGKTYKNTIQPGSSWGGFTALPG